MHRLILKKSFKQNFLLQQKLLLSNDVRAGALYYNYDPCQQLWIASHIFTVITVLHII